MSIHSSFRGSGALAKHRNVLTRAERIARLKSLNRYQDGQPVTSLPKVRNIKMK